LIRKILFGLQLNDLSYPKINLPNKIGIHYFGPKNLLLFLEQHLGLSGHPNNNEYLRIEQYRQAMLHWEEQNSACFFKASFAADQFATATALLQLRDELLLAGWNFQIKKGQPNRLKDLAGIEQLFSAHHTTDESITKSLELHAGFADRFMEVINNLPTKPIDLEEIQLNEPLDLLPAHFQQLFRIFEKQGVTISSIPFKTIRDNNDLSNYKKSLLRQQDADTKFDLKNDGSLLIIKSKRETDAAAWLAQFLRQNPNFQPACLIPEKNRALDNSLIQEGLPSLGILSASLARPSLQILKLIPAFLWNPIDPFKILEFVSLSVKPLADDLAIEIARQMAQTPGLNSDNWYFMKMQYFQQLEEKAQNDNTIDVNGIKEQFQFWFERKRYDSSKRVPKEDVIEIFEYLANWAYDEFDNSSKKNNSLMVLTGQARRVVDLLEVLPPSMNFLTVLELERIVRTIYEPSPIKFKEQELQHFPYVHQPSAFIGDVDQLIWWNFIQNERDHFFSRWYPSEIQFLEKEKVRLLNPKNENALLLWQRPRPFLHCQKQAILIIPEMVNGSTVYTHPLYDELEACFNNLETITFNLDSKIGQAAFEKHFKTPQLIELEAKKLGSPKAFIEIKSAEKLGQNEKESFSSLDALFYYPYQWVFRHKIKLRKSSILSIVKDITLMGNLSHRFFELMFDKKENNDIYNWDRSDVYEWIDSKAKNLLSKEGAVLLKYGREPEKIAFLNRVKYAAWSLISMIRENGWTVKDTESRLHGKFSNIEMKGIADLVLERGDELAVIDLKWRGASRRKMMIKNEEDLQLVMYSRLLTEDDSWAHTAYFILENGSMISRNELAFKDAIPVAPNSQHEEINQRIYEMMEKTYQWRLHQLNAGKIEIRTAQTAQELEEIYGDELIEILEMRRENAMFDDYRTLINLVS